MKKKSRVEGLGLHNEGGCSAQEALNVLCVSVTGVISPGPSSSARGE